MSRHRHAKPDVPGGANGDTETHGTTGAVAAALSCLETAPILAGSAAGGHDAEALVHRLVLGAVNAVPTADAGGVAELTAGAVRTRAATLPMVAELDRLAVERDEGPLMDATWARPGSATVTDLDDTSQRRWPRWTRRARAAGVGTVLTVLVPRSTRRRARVLTLYGTATGTFEASSAAVAQAFAAPLTVALPAARRVAALERGLASRDVIGQAKGVLMARLGVDAGAAFEQLVGISQRSNTRLAEIASRLVKAVETEVEGKPTASVPEVFSIADTAS